MSDQASHMRTFSAKDRVAAFPLGGIGTGNVSLGARGDLRDWEIFNHAGKGTPMPNTFFAIRAQAGDDAPVARVLEGPIPPPNDLSHGYHPWTAAGLPRLAGATMRGEYPFAWIDFQDDKLPVQVSLEAYTPLVPLNPDDSGIPGAIFTYTVRNLGEKPVALTITGSLINTIGGVGFDNFGNIAAGGTGQNVNELRQEDALRGLYFYSEQYPTDNLRYGNMSLTTTHSDITVKRHWLRGAWYDFLQEFWDDFSADGLLTDLGYDTPSEMGHTDTGSLGLVDTLQSGEEKQYRFLLTWYFPNRTNSWNNKPTAPVIRNHYALKFGDSWAVAQYLTENAARLDAETRQFHAAMFDSTLPPYVLDAVSANIVPLRSPTCFWLEDGRFYGFEGCFDSSGSCDGNCTHVWSYAQTLAFLFPSLEREMRRIEFEIETDDSGYMYFRTYKTFGGKFIWGWGDQEPEAASDGQMGSILRAYREWRLSGDREWLAAVWPGIKRAIAFAATHWDTDRDHVLDGRQHNTYDIEFYGPNPLSQFYYLAGLLAVEQLAGVMGEPDLAANAREAFNAGSKRADEMMWNGEFFVQRIEDVNAYKYQHGEGCLSDQLLGQLHAHILGLGDLLPAEHIKSAIGAVFGHNFKRDFREHVNCQRTYVLNGESGLLLCTWPNGGRPRFPFVYSDEVWTGIEYQVAAELIYDGWLNEGLEIVREVRNRHDGVRRSPWNEVECGHHYARSMASWAVLLALSGFQSDVAGKMISFDPAMDKDNFRSFFSAGTAWGSFAQRADDTALNATIRVDYGELALGRVCLKPTTQAVYAAATLRGEEVPVRVEQNGMVSVLFDQELTLAAGETLEIKLTYL